FLNRWSKRKAGIETDESSDLKKQPNVSSSTISEQAEVSSLPKINSDGVSSTDETPKEVLPTLEDVLKLTKDSDYSAYVKPGIDPAVQQAAMQKLFSDPHYNIMDGLDIYIDDYSKPDPIPLEMLKQLNQSQLLGLFKTSDEDKNNQTNFDRDVQGNNQEQQTQNALPDETPSDINSIDSAKSLELNNSQEVTNTNQAKPADKAG
ncbi:MAG: DUF3306 domain-containing protein, partial [Polynucleobacter victoriensis]